MDSAYKTLWVEALRSGDYQQGHGFLVYTWETPIEYCALGVLCAIHPDLGKYIGIYASGALNSPYSYDLPFDLEKAVGLDYEAQTDVITLNDASRHTFQHIADWIEENL